MTNFLFYVDVAFKEYIELNSYLSRNGFGISLNAYSVCKMKEILTMNGNHTHNISLNVT